MTNFAESKVVDLYHSIFRHPSQHHHRHRHPRSRPNCYPNRMRTFPHYHNATRQLKCWCITYANNRYVLQTTTN